MPLDLERRRAYRRAWHAANREKILGQRRKSYLNNKAKINARNTKWRKDNRVKANASRRAWAAANPEKRATHILRGRYGISLSDYDVMFTRQNGICAICACAPKDGKRLHVDHDHSTGKVRGLLCMRCNTSLERYESYGQKMLAYIARYKNG